MILGQLRIGARQAKNAPLDWSNFFSYFYPSLHWLPIVEYIEFLLFANFNETLQIWRQNFPWRFERLFQDLSVNLSDSTKVPSIQSLQIHIKRSNDQASEWESWDGEMRKAVGTAFEYLFHHYHHNHLHHHYCTMLLSQCKWVSFEFESEYLQCPHFLVIQLFQIKYLGSVTLSLHICRTSW